MARSPLYDLYDPYGLLRQQAEAGLLPGDEPGEMSRQATVSDLMPEEERRSMLRTLADTGSSGLAAAGWILDTPGSMVRGMLSGGPSKALSALWETSDQRVTGRELLRQNNLIGSEDNWGNFAGGLIGEMALDPLTYLNPLAILGKGAYNGAGRALRDSGLLRSSAVDAYRGFDQMGPLREGVVRRPAGVGVREHMRNMTPAQAIAEAPDYDAALQQWNLHATRHGVDPADMHQRIAGLMDARIPGTNIGFNVDAGATGDRIARGLDQFGEWSKRAPGIGPVVSRANALLHNPSGFTLDPDIQWSSRIARADNQLADEALRLARTRMQRAALTANVPAQVPTPFLEAGTEIPRDLRDFQSPRLQNAMGDYVEAPHAMPPGVHGPMPERTSGDPMADWVMENVPQFRDIRDHFAGMGDRAADLATANGLPRPRWTSDHQTGWFPRQLHWFEQDAAPTMLPMRLDAARAAARGESPWSQGSQVLNTQDNFGRSRNAALDVEGGMRTIRALTGNGQTVNPAGFIGPANRFDSAGLQSDLLHSTPRASRRLIDDAFTQLGLDTPYRTQANDVMASAAYQAADPAERIGMLRGPLAEMRERKGHLADFLRGLDTQFASTNRGAFDTSSWSNALRYELGQNRVIANTQQVVRNLAEGAINTPVHSVAGGGVVSLADAAATLGFDPVAFRRMWQQQHGADVTNFSVPERLVKSLGTLAAPTRPSLPESGLLGALGQFTSAFKGGALASPAFHVRNSYSGMVSAAAHNAFNPADWYASLQASRGNYDPLGRRLAHAPGYADLPDARARVDEYLAQTGAYRVGQGTLLDDIAGRPDQSIQGMYTGANTGPGVGQAFYNPERSWGQFGDDFFRMRGVGITSNPLSRSTNPMLVLNDSVGRNVEDALRTGTMLTQVRRGIHPGQAADISKLTQVDYSPEAFTPFERGVKQAVPFYSFMKGILPSIGDNLLYRPGGLQGQAIRAVTRGTERSEDSFVPDYLRQSAAIALPEALGGKPSPNLQRYLTSGGLPFESTFNLFSPGVGNSLASKAADSVQKTAMNFAGQLNPLLKYAIEGTTNRQLYSGRQMSDLYSMLEQDMGPMGRHVEQAVSNLVPFGARILGTTRQLRDNRMSMPDRLSKAAFNILAGAKFTDVDQERTQQLAARSTLDSLLSTTPGVRSYENLTVPDDVLRAMPPEQQKQYLLYKMLQSEASKRSRKRKKEAALLDPMQMLGR